MSGRKADEMISLLGQTPTTVAINVAPSVSHLERMATVELQLVMHYCDKVTLIRLARCNRMTLTAAAHSFAWKYLSPLKLRSVHPSEIKARLSSRSLLRFVDVAMTWWVVSQSNITDEQIDAVASIPRLHSLETSPKGIMLRDAGVAKLCEAMRRRGCILQSLCLRGEGIQSDGAAALAAFIRENITLTSLELHETCSLSADVITTIVAAIGCSKSMQKFRIGCFFSEDESSSTLPTTLAAALARSDSLTEVDLTEISLTDADTSLLAPGIQNSRSLQRLLLNGYSLGKRGAMILANAIAHNGNLTVFHLDTCNIRDGGSVALITALQQCQYLHTLNLSDNNLDTNSVNALIQLLQNSCTLTSMNLDDNLLGEDGVVKLAAVLHRTSSLHRLDLVDTNGGSVGVAALAAAIDRGWSPRNLSFGGGTYNPISDEGIIAFALTLSARGHTLPLEFLHMIHCGPLAKNDVLAIVRATQLIPALRMLELPCNLSTFDFDKSQLDILSARIARPDIKFIVY